MHGVFPGGSMSNYDDLTKKNFAFQPVPVRTTGYWDGAHRAHHLIDVGACRGVRSRRTACSLADLLSAADICPAFNDKKAELYASQEWQDRANSTAVFLAQVEEITGIVNVTLENFYDVWDPISCQISHKLVTNNHILENFAQIQALADWVRQ